MTTVFPVQSGGWQPVSDDSTISIWNVASGLKASEYLIHFNEDDDYYVFFKSDSTPISVQLVGTNLTVNSDSPSYLQRVRQNNSNTEYISVGNGAILIDKNNTTGGFQLTQRYYIDNSTSKIFGLQCLNVSSYDISKLVCISDNSNTITTDTYNINFLTNPFTIKLTSRDLLTSSIITTNDNIFYIICDNQNDSSLLLQISFYEYFNDNNYTIGGDTGIVISDDFTGDKSLTIEVSQLDIDQLVLHGRSKPVIKFANNNLDNVSINVKAAILGFVEPPSVVQPVAFKLKTGTTSSAGAILLSDVSSIRFDTTTELTIRETSVQPTLEKPVIDSIFALNVESLPSLATGNVYFSVAYITNAPGGGKVLKPILLTEGGDTDEGKYTFQSTDAVYLVMFILGEQSGDKWPAKAQVLGKIILDDGSVNIDSIKYIPTQLIQMGEPEKQQLVYINIGDGSNTLTTNTSMQYVLPYDTNVFRSSDLKASGIETWPASLNTDDIISCVNGDITFEFSKNTDDMFKSYALEDTEHTTNIFNTTIKTAGEININNYIYFPEISFDNDKPFTINANSTRITINNINDGLLLGTFINTTDSLSYNYYMYNYKMPVNDAWKVDTVGNTLPDYENTIDKVSTDTKCLTIDGKVFVCMVNKQVIDIPDIVDNTLTFPPNQIVSGINVYEIVHEADTYNNKNIGYIGTRDPLFIGISDSDIFPRYHPSKALSFDGYGNIVEQFGQTLPVVSSEIDIPDYIVTRTVLQQPNDLISFNLLWFTKVYTTLNTKITGFTPTRTHTIESSADMTITLTNEVDWTKTNQLILKGGTWIVNNKSNSEIGSIMNNGVSVITSAPGWENKYLSQIGANSSIQKNLQTIYDALGQTVNRVSVGDEIQYAMTVNNFSNDLFQELIDRISNAMQVSVRSGENKISDYTVKLGSEDSTTKSVLVVFNIPSKDGSTPKEITAEVSLNLLTSDGDQSTEQDYYKMFYNTTEKTVIFSKNVDGGGNQLTQSLYNGVAIKRVGQTPKLFFNNSVLVITTPLFAEDFDGELPDTITEQFISPTSNGRLVYKLVGISNLILVDTVNKAGVVITDGFE